MKYKNKYKNYVLWFLLQVQYSSLAHRVMSLHHFFSNIISFIRIESSRTMWVSKYSRGSLFGEWGTIIWRKHKLKEENIMLKRGNDVWEENVWEEMMFERLQNSVPFFSTVRFSPAAEEEAFLYTQLALWVEFASPFRIWWTSWPSSLPSWLTGCSFMRLLRSFLPYTSSRRECFQLNYWRVAGMGFTSMCKCYFPLCWVRAMEGCVSVLSVMILLH